MQKMQQAGGKGRGAGGMPTPAQIQAMQVCFSLGLYVYRILKITSGQCRLECCSRCKDSSKVIMAYKR
jgi:hypothetical protein